MIRTTAGSILAALLVALAVLALPEQQLDEHTPRPGTVGSYR